MHITQFTDYSLRVLLYLGLKGERATVAEISGAFRISRNHLVKVVHHLSQRGYIDSQKGKNGGITLKVAPEKVRIGEVVKELEPLKLLECFDPAHNTCPIQGVCKLERTLHEATRSFLGTLNTYTLADFLKPGTSRDERLRLLKISS